MPRITTHTVARILEWVMLQAFIPHADPTTPGEQEVSIGRNEVREMAPEPEVAMEPETTTHGVDHPRPAIGELLPVEKECARVLRGLDRRTRQRSRITHWQATTPSEIAGAIGAMLPLNIAQVRGYERGCVADADHPPAVAPTIDSCVPLVVRYCSAIVSVL